MTKDLTDGFIELRCCDTTAGFVNPRLFTPEANKRFCEIQQRLGNAWTNDPEALALVNDPASHAPPPDGTPIAFSCNKCQAKFAWVNGIPVKIAKS